MKMKKLISLLFIACVVWTLASCGNGGDELQIETLPTIIVPPVELDLQEEINGQEEIPETSDEPFEGKIAIITRYFVDYFSIGHVLPILARYGEEKIIHEMWPLFIANDQDGAIMIIDELSNNLDVKVIIANPVDFSWSIEGFERLREAREDIFLVFCVCSIRSSVNLPEQIRETADLILMVDVIGTGAAMVRQAYKMGAETFVHYSLHRHMDPSEFINNARRDLIEQECAELGIRFIEVKIPEDITWDSYYRRLFLREDIQRVIQNYGKDTAFFGHFANEILWSVIEFGGIFPQPRDLFMSPFNPFLGTFDIHSSLDEDFIDIHLAAEKAILSARRHLDERGMRGRISNWPVPYEFMFTHAATEYAIKRLNGEVTSEGIDVDVLRSIMEEYAGVNVYLTPFTNSETGEVHENVLMMRMGYFIY